MLTLIHIAAAWSWPVVRSSCARLGSHQRCMLSILVDHESCCAQEIWIVNHTLATARRLVQEAEDLAFIKEQRRTPRRRGTLGLVLATQVLWRGRSQGQSRLSSSSN